MLLSTFQYVRQILFNPYILSFRFWNMIYKMYYSVFDINPINDPDNIRKSYLTTVAYSLICSVISPYSFYLLFFMNDNWLLNFVANTYYYLSITYFSSDLYLGYHYYKNILDRDYFTSYFHHSVYIVLLGYANYYNRLNYAILAAPYEISTVSRSLGYINKDFRNDMEFGKLFFIFRILYNLILVFYSYYNNINDLLYFSIGTFMLHSYWFKGFVVKHKLI